MMSVDNRLRMIRLIEKIERNRKLADEMHVSNRSILKSVDRKQTRNTKGEKEYEKCTRMDERKCICKTFF